MRILLMHSVPVTVPYLSVDSGWMQLKSPTMNIVSLYIWVRDSVAARKLGYVKAGADGNRIC